MATKAKTNSDGRRPLLNRAARLLGTRLRIGGQRIRANMSQLLQVTIGATVAYAFCKLVLGHSYPFLAAVAAAVGTGVTVDRRLRRAMEIGFGATFGVLVGEFFVNIFGTGVWQIAVVMIIGLLIGTMINSGGIFITQIAVQSVYVVTVPASTGAQPFSRTIDALTGASVAIIMALLVPNDARKAPRDRASTLLREISELLHGAGQALKNSDHQLAYKLLERARDSQSMVDSWRSSLRVSEEAARINARSRRYAAEVTRLARACEYVDRSMRLVRVILRRIVGVTEVHRDRPVVGDMLDGMGDGADLLREALRRGGSRQPAEMRLREVAAQLSPQNPKLMDLQDETLVLLMRPLANDLLGACGLTETAAEEYLPDLVPTGPNPKAAASGHTVVRTKTHTMPLVQQEPKDDSSVGQESGRAQEHAAGGTQDPAQDTAAEEGPADPAAESEAQESTDDDVTLDLALAAGAFTVDPRADTAADGPDTGPKRAELPVIPTAQRDTSAEQSSQAEDERAATPSDAEDDGENEGVDEGADESHTGEKPREE